VAEPVSIILAGPDLLPSLRRRVGGLGGEILAFAENEALSALDAITKRQPRLIVLEREFASTPRGTALTNRIKADPALEQSEIRVMAAEGDFSRVIRRLGEAGGGTGATATATVKAPAAPLDQRGTRRAPRFRMAAGVEMVVEGATAILVDLSTIGAQVISPGALRPQQRVRVSVMDDGGGTKCHAAVAWASFEIQPKMGARYRAGLEFVDADASSIDAFCQRRKA
jgi:hypothetical protein